MLKKIFNLIKFSIVISFILVGYCVIAVLGIFFIMLKNIILDIAKFIKIKMNILLKMFKN